MSFIDSLNPLELCLRPRTNERCKRHPENMLTLFCSLKQCLEPMCQKCLEYHKEIHENLGLGEVEPLDLKQVEDHCENSINKELNLIKECKDNIFKPQQVIYKVIDKYFFGSINNRQKVLEHRKQAIQQQFDAHLLIRIIEEGHTYELTPGFEERYFSLLDRLIGEAANRHEQNERKSSRY